MNKYLSISVQLFVLPFSGLYLEGDNVVSSKLDSVVSTCMAKT